MAGLNGRNTVGPRPVLLYRATCGKCRLLSLLAVALSCGRIRRIANDDPVADALTVARGLRRTKILLVDADSAARGWGVVPGLLRASFRIGRRRRSRDRTTAVDHDGAAW
jgi:hypothetical protein